MKRLLLLPIRLLKRIHDEFVDSIVAWQGGRAEDAEYNEDSTQAATSGSIFSTFN